jgi:threonine synthase
VKDKIEKDEKVMLLMTGSGLKDFGALKVWNDKPPVKSSVEWKEILIKVN